MDHFGSIDQLFPFAPTLHMNFCGHLFFNLLFIYKGKEMNFCGGKKELDLSLQGSIIKEITMEEVTSIFGKTPWWEKIKNTIMHLKFIQCQRSSEVSFIKKLETYQISPASTAKGFYINIDRELPEFYKAWVTSLILTTESATWSHIVMNIFKQGKFTLTPKMSSDIAALFSSCPNILSADIPNFLEAISKQIKVQGEAEEFLKMDAQTAASWLLSQQSGESGKKFQSFLQKHGYRCLREAELYVKCWEAEPTKLIPVIKATLRNNNPDTKKADKISEEAIASIKSSLSKFQRFILHFALPSARKGIIHREFGKAGAIKMTDIFRRAYWKLATLMVQEGFLPDEDLIFFLTHMEIGKLLLHRSPALISRAQRRRRLLEKQMLLKFKELNNGKPVPIDNSSKATENTTTGLKLTGAVVAREYGIPCIVSCANATSLLRSGDIVILNAEEGFVEKVGESGSTDSV
ncbi:putative phosphoenolpyruvate synthase isoform X2 [Pristis pectinata]|uniref:putative phosphoenolpyruvate synthase isoform X2 n=1 Tax=Pristis pectinata TaxID=685728 RepID=UPI00223E350D|nr:putative phosphoenolpyruvate synthase isoform X2 [Pristis pectinata]